MKNLKKTAEESNMNKVMQELTAAGLHIDNEESHKKNNKNIKNCYKNKPKNLVDFLA